MHTTLCNAPTPTLTRSAASVRVRVCTTLLMPLVQVDMANHNGVQPPKTAKGLEPGGEHFVVLATQAFAKGEIGGAWICKRAPNIVTHPAACEHRHSLRPAVCLFVYVRCVVQASKSICRTARCRI